VTWLCVWLFATGNSQSSVRTTLASCVQYISVRHKAVVAHAAAIIVAYEYTYPEHGYIIKTMNTKHERCRMAFLLQAAHKIAVSCPKTFIESCSGKWNRPRTLHGGKISVFLVTFALKIREMALLRDFHSQPIHGHAVFTPCMRVPTHLPRPNLSARAEPISQGQCYR